MGRGAEGDGVTESYIWGQLTRLGLAAAVVGKERVVGDIGIAGVRAQLDDLAEHREAAEAGIEYQDGRRDRQTAAGQ